MADGFLSERQRLLERLLEAVKQCQVRFGGRSELATDSDSRVSSLSTQLEAVFQHGLRRSRKLLNIKKPESEPVFWHCVKEALNPDEVDFILRMNNVTTDAGRGRAWLRVTLNERTLETKIHQLLADYKHLSGFYEPHAFFFDVERSSMLPMMAAGLGSILFALQPDRAELDYQSKPAAPVPAPKAPTDAKNWSTPAAVMPQSAQDDELVTASSSQHRKKKKKSLNRPAIRSMSMDTDTPPVVSAAAAAAASSNTAGLSPLPAGDEQQQGEAASGTTSPDRLVQTAIAGHAEVVERVRAYLDNAATPRSVSSEPTSPEVSAVIPGSDIVNSEISWDSLLRRPTPKDFTEDAANTMAAYADSDSSSASSSNAGSRAMDYGLDDSVVAMKAMRSLSLAQTEADAPSPLAEVKATVSSTSQLSPEDMRAALLTMAKRKDEVELQNRLLEEERASELARSAELQQQLQEIRDLSSTEREQSRTHAQALTRENELLKHQLKKYVGVVQNLKRETIAGLPAEAAEAMATLRHGAVAADPIPPPRRKTKEYQQAEEDSQFERKLVQVAEMHGELLEFNQFMHQQMVNKDKVIAIMRTQLASARGVPVHDVSIPGSPHAGSPDRLQPQERAPGAMPTTSLISHCLLNVWIPSVFLYGKGGDGYHVYQVFIRVRDEEWNVYRRYAQFHEFRKHVIQSVPSASRLDFPKKKSFRNKQSSFVEIRRLGLEKFLRSVLQLLLSGAAKGTSYHMAVDQLCKNLLSQHLPFFRQQRVAPSGGRPAHQPLATRMSPQYNGL